MERKNNLWFIRLLVLPIKLLYIALKHSVLFLVSIPARLSGKRVVRRKKGSLQTPIINMRHPKSGREITLFGMIHIADREYFDMVQKRVDVLESLGYLVLFERIKKSELSEISALKKNEQIVYREFKQISEFMKWAAKTCDFTHQNDGITIGKNWINTDMTMVDLVRSIAEKGHFKENKFDLPSGKDIPAFRYFFSLFIFYIDVGLGKLLQVFESKKERLRHKLRDEIILGGRNELAVEGIMRFPDRNIVAMWGAAHLPEIISKLRQEHGYELFGRTWITSFTRKYFLKDMLRDLNLAAPRKNSARKAAA